jgi:hypothetical protein
LVRRREPPSCGRWQVRRIVSERQTDAGFEYEVIAGNGLETRTTWRYWADLDQELLQGLLKQFKAKQRTRRYKARATSRR